MCQVQDVDVSLSLLGVCMRTSASRNSFCSPDEVDSDELSGYKVMLTSSEKLCNVG